MTEKVEKLQRDVIAGSGYSARSHHGGAIDDIILEDAQNRNLIGADVFQPLAVVIAPKPLR